MAPNKLPVKTRIQPMNIGLRAELEAPFALPSAMPAARDLVLLARR